MTARARHSVRSRRLLVVVTLVAATAACGGDGPERGARSPETTREPAPTTVPATSPPAPTTTTIVPDIHGVTHPLNLPDPTVAWYHHVAPAGTEVLFGVVRATSGAPGPRPAIVLLPGSDGFSAEYVSFARDLAAHGFDVGFGCWWANLPIPDEPADSARILCPEAPAFKGVVDAAVPDVDALVEGVAHALGDPAQVAVLGFSRGGGIAALRAAAGRPEAVVSVAGMVDGTHPFGVVPGGEVRVLDRVDGIHAPFLFLHAVDDAAVPVTQAQDLEAALRERGGDVEANYYSEGGHGLLQVPWIRADVVERVTAFLCARFTCAP